MDKPLITIITVVKNAKYTIEKTIRSVISQKQVSVQYIVIDAESDDGTSDLIRMYDKCIDIYIREADDGLYYAMNKALNLANGDIIGILNSDDYYAEELVLSNLVDRFIESDADIVYGNAMYYDDNNIHSLYPTNEYELWFRMGIPHPATFVRKRVYDSIGYFDTQYRICADYDFILRAYVNNVVMEHFDKVVTYFKRGGMNERNEFLRYRELKAISLKYAHLLKNGSFLTRRLYENTLEWVLSRKEIDSGRYFERIFETNKIAIWGAGKFGMKLAKYMVEKNIPIDFFVDYDTNKVGNNICGYVIHSPEYLSDYKGNVIIATKKYSEQISEKLNKMGIISRVYTWENLEFRLTQSIISDVGRTI